MPGSMPIMVGGSVWRCFSLLSWTSRWPGEDYDDDDDMTMMKMMTAKVNTMAVMEATEVVMERMSGRGGLIVNTASLAGVGDGGDHRNHADHDNHDNDHDNHWPIFNNIKRNCEFNWKWWTCKLPIFCFKTCCGKKKHLSPKEIIFHEKSNTFKQHNKIQ